MKRLIIAVLLFAGTAFAQTVIITSPAGIAYASNFTVSLLGPGPACPSFFINLYCGSDNVSTWVIIQPAISGSFFVHYTYSVADRRFTENKVLDVSAGTTSNSIFFTPSGTVLVSVVVVLSHTAPSDAPWVSRAGH